MNRRLRRPLTFETRSTVLTQCSQFHSQHSQLRSVTTVLIDYGLTKHMFNAKNSYQMAVFIRSCRTQSTSASRD